MARAPMSNLTVTEHAAAATLMPDVPKCRGNRACQRPQATVHGVVFDICGASRVDLAAGPLAMSNH